MRKTPLVVLAAVAFAAAGCASGRKAVLQVTSQEVGYRSGDLVLQGHLALPAPAGSKMPAVLVVHEWWGRTPHSDHSAEELAKLGYVGFAVDMYGEGRSTSDPQKAGEWSGEVRKDPAVAMRRLQAALDFVRARPEVDPSRVACIGYCFGGTMSLEAAWAGLDLRGVVSFHGSLTTPKADQVPGVKTSILVCHGADDPLVGEDVVDAFQRSMRDGRFDWEVVAYGGAVHSFTNPSADGSFNAGVRYHPVAAARSWALMKDFLAERFQ